MSELVDNLEHKIEIRRNEMLINGIINVIQESNHEVVLEVQKKISNAVEYNEAEPEYIRIFREWLDDLQEMHENIERLYEVESAIYCAQSSMEDIQNNLDDLGGHLNV